MRKTIIIALLIGATNFFVQGQQETTLIETVNNLQTQINQQQNDIQKLYSELNKEYRTYRIVKKDLNQTIIYNQEKVVDSLNTLIKKSSNKLSSINEQLSTKIQQTNDNTNSKISELDSSLDNNRLYWIIATLAMLLLGGLFYWLLGKRIASSKTDVETQIKNTKMALEEESVKLDSQLLEIISSQLKIKGSENSSFTGQEKDHSLVLKVTDEVTRILMNLEVMDKNIKGYKHLKKYSESILDNLKAYGYEIPKLIGQNYNSGMNMVATLEFDDSIEEGKQIIKRIIKPQVNFDKKMIQAAKVIVAFNE